MGFYAGTAEISDTHSHSGITERSAPQDNPAEPGRVMAFTFRTIRFLIFQPVINRWHFFVSITIIFLKGTSEIFTFKEDDCERKNMAGFT
ncbi:hypothetical protein NFB44_15875 [Yersinia ruckeri]|uniref:hypothetical protein n=1 Tax=Yersinia TaxID=629 RepID=UPI0005AC80D0|nr:MULTISPECIES: hypothetical protein [Yersinia]MCW6556836.1 hypothetical protein [Yersinia ruckeri]UZX76804.1 hypothetical protein ND012_09395 [Yersinia ruckeri]